MIGDSVTSAGAVITGSAEDSFFSMVGSTDPAECEVLLS
jgi:hypothetical protein